MFLVDDNFLTSVGYDVAMMSDAEKETIQQQFTQDLNQRFALALMQELDEDQQVEFNDIQENPARAYRWLDEFHGDYRSRADFNELLQNGYSEEDAATYYASLLWMSDAVPGFGQVAQRVFAQFQAELVQQRQQANAALGL